MDEAAQNPSFQQQQQQQQKRVVIGNKYGNKLVGILHEAPGTKDIVILCHGFRASKENIIMTQLAASLENTGISSFRFDFSGNGESEGSFEFANYWREVDDLQAVVQHFHESNRRVVAIIGHSKGAVVVLLYASKYRDIKVVVNISGCYDLKGALEGCLGENFMEKIRNEGFIQVKTKSGIDFRITERSLKGSLNTYMLEACLQIDKECRILTVHGDADTANPVRPALEFAKILPNHKLHVIQGADHVYTDHLAQLVSIVVNFMKETIAAGP